MRAAVVDKGSAARGANSLSVGCSVRSRPGSIAGSSLYRAALSNRAKPMPWCTLAPSP